MRVALIPPNGMVHHTSLTDIQMVLANNIVNLEQERWYTYPYISLHRSDTPWCCSHIILDNGACEGELVTPEQLFLAAHKIAPHELIVPDVLRDSEATIKAYQEFMPRFSEWRKYYAGWPDLVRRIRLMVVLQGKNATECMDMWRELEHEEIDIWGIPRHLVLDDPMARLEIATRIRALDDNRPLHALGAETQYPDEVRHLGAYIRSIDTSLPYVYGMAGIELHKPDNWKHLDRSDTYFAPTAPRARLSEQLCLKNVGTYLRWAYGS